MSKIVDNLLDKFDQFRRKVMSDTETTNDIQKESAGSGEIQGESADLKFMNSEPVVEQNEQKTPTRPRRRKPRTKSKSKSDLTQKKSAGQPSQQQKGGKEEEDKSRT